jgi:hypothetical protein
MIISIGVGIPYLAILGSGNAGFMGTIDKYPGAVTGYSLKLLRVGYSGPCINVRRSSDNATQDIGFVNNVVDSASLLLFVGAGDGFVTAWYDQSGNSRDFVQATAGNQPKIVSSGAVNTINSNPTIVFDGSSSYFNQSSSLGIFQNVGYGYTFCTSFYNRTSNIGGSSAAAYSAVTGNGSFANRISLVIGSTASNYTAGVRRLDADTGVSSGTGSGINSLAVITSAAIFANGTIQAFRNSVAGALTSMPSGAGLSSNTPSSYAPTLCAALSPAAQFFYGSITEFVQYNTNVTGSRSAIESDTIANYGIT